MRAFENDSDERKKKNNVCPAVSIPLDSVRHIYIPPSAKNDALYRQESALCQAKKPLAKVSSRSFLWAAFGAALTYMGVFAVGLIALMACHPVGLAGVAMAGLVKAAIPSVFAYKLMAGGAFIGFCGGSIFDKPESDRSSHRPKF